MSRVSFFGNQDWCRLPELLDVCHRILVIRDGRIIREVDPGSATEALLEPLRPYVGCCLALMGRVGVAVRVTR